jgi:hypothetical protein
MQRAIRFGIDSGRAKIAENMNKYIHYAESYLKSDKEYFRRHYQTDGLDVFLMPEDEIKRFTIPCEMVELYCLMTATMKTSPTYGNKKINHSLQDIIAHNETIIRHIEKLPPVLADYIKSTPEYYNALCFAGYMPLVIDRISALLHLALDTTDIPLQTIFDNLVESLDAVYEEHFWQLARKESVAEVLMQTKDDFIKIFGKDFNISNLEIYHALENVLANIFKELDRSNWPTGAAIEADRFIKSLERKYREADNKDDEIKQEFLLWLYNQKWHVLNKKISSSVSAFFAADDLIKQSIEEHNEKYNMRAITHPALIEGSRYNVNAGEPISDEKKKKIESEMQQIRGALQNEIDRYLILKLIYVLNDTDSFAAKFKNPLVQKLSGAIYSYIEKLLSLKSDREELLKSYLYNINDILLGVDNKYKKYGLMDYAGLVLKGEKEFEECCHEIYLTVYLKVQSQKCSKFNAKEYGRLSNDIGNAAGNRLREILLKKETKRD